MDKPEATRKEIAAAIKGYGHFAVVCIEFVFVLTISKYAGHVLEKDVRGKVVLFLQFCTCLVGFC